MKLHSFFVFFLILLLSVACGKREEEETFGSESFLCAAFASNFIVNSGQAFTVDISAVGGATPYMLNGTTSFMTSTTLTDTQTVTQTTSISESVTVTDATGQSTTCAYTVTVLAPGDNTGGDFACSAFTLGSISTSGEYVILTAVVEPNVGSGNYEVTDVEVTKDSQPTNDVHFMGEPITNYHETTEHISFTIPIMFFGNGDYLLEVSLEDMASGATAQCNTLHTNGDLMIQ